MLYITTRNNRDPFTAHRAMVENRCPDGGFFLPFRHPKFTQSEIDALAEKTFGQCVAEVLNRLFNTRLTGWDVDFCCGRAPVRLSALRHRILIAESWHNPSGQFNHIVRALAERLCGEKNLPSDWINIAVRASVLFGIFSELKRRGIDHADISVVSGDFAMPISAWYARHWGLPVGKIICCCNENNSLWELFCHGQMRTDTVSVPTMIPEADISVPPQLERLVCEAGGLTETERYLECCRRGAAYYPGDSILAKLRNGMYASVVSSHRLETAIPGVYRTHGYLMTPGTALAYAGLLDYRAKTGETGEVLIWAEESPAVLANAIGSLVGLPVEEIERRQ